jgi:hypothetical protein
MPPSSGRYQGLSILPEFTCEAIPTVPVSGNIVGRGRNEGVGIVEESAAPRAAQENGYPEVAEPEGDRPTGEPNKP